MKEEGEAMRNESGERQRAAGDKGAAGTQVSLAGGQFQEIWLQGF